MRLRPEFEALSGSILRCHPLPSINDVVSEFIAEETRLRLSSPSQAPPQSGSTLTTPHRAPNRNTPAQKSSPREPLHHQFLGKQVICNYCKKPGHMLANCR